MVMWLNIIGPSLAPGDCSMYSTTRQSTTGLKSKPNYIPTSHSTTKNSNNSLIVEHMHPFRINVHHTSTLTEKVETFKETHLNHFDLKTPQDSPSRPPLLPMPPRKSKNIVIGTNEDTMTTRRPPLPFRTVHHVLRNDDLRARAMIERSLRLFERPFQDPSKEYCLRVQPHPPPERKEIDSASRRTPDSVLKFFGALDNPKEFYEQDKVVSKSRADLIVSKTPRPTSARTVTSDTQRSIPNSQRPKFRLFTKERCADVMDLHKMAAEMSPFIEHKKEEDDRNASSSIPPEQGVAAKHSPRPSSAKKDNKKKMSPMKTSSSEVGDGGGVVASGEADFVASWVSEQQRKASVI
eukprot:PhF_6_TR24847/c0_g1_i3/m.34284